MTVDKLWAPWRSKYIYMRRHKRCIFCGARSSRNDESRYIIEKSKHTFALLNTYPYNNGHVMVAPYRHAASLELLFGSETADLMKLINKVKVRLDRKLSPQGYNIGLNVGRAAGAGFAGHVHVHIVPRWVGDTNFMPMTADTKVVSESLDAMYKLLRVKR